MTLATTDINTPINASGVIDLDPAFGLVSGRLALVQALARRVTTERGTLAWIGDDPEYGDDVRAFLGDDVEPRQSFVVSSRVERELLRDERVRGARVAASIASGRLTISAQVSDADGPFRFTLAVTAVSVETLKVF